MDRHEKAVVGGLRAWLLVLLVGNALFAVLTLYSGISQAVQMGPRLFTLLQVATGAICVLNIAFICSVLRQGVWGAYGLVAGLGSAATLFAASWWTSADPADPSERGAVIVLSAVVFAIGLVVTAVSAMVLRPVMKRPSR